jgi:putative transposase
MSTQTAAKRARARTPDNKTTTGFRISDELWAVLEPLLPVRVNPHRFGGGRPRVPDRRCADAIVYVLRTGSQWAALNETELCAKSTAHDRCAEWAAAGVSLKLWQAGGECFDEMRGIDWSWLSMDGAMTKAPLGGGKDGAQSDRPGQRRRQTQFADGRPRRSDRLGDRRREPARHEAGAGNAREQRGGAAGPDGRAAAGDVPG